MSGMGWEETWRSMLSDQSKYIIVDPQKLLEPIKNKNLEQTSYLKKIYW